MHITSNKNFVKSRLLDEAWFEALSYSVSNSNPIGAKVMGSGEVGFCDRLGHLKNSYSREVTKTSQSTVKSVLSILPLLGRIY